MKARLWLAGVCGVVMAAGGAQAWADPFSVGGQKETRAAPRGKQIHIEASPVVQQQAPVPDAAPEPVAVAQPESLPAPVAASKKAGMPCSRHNGQILNKLGRGTGNFLAGWMEIPLQIGRRTGKTNDSATDFFAGTALGIGKALQRTAVGAFELLTFPFPIEGDCQILPTLDYFDRSKSHEHLPLE